MDNRGGTISFNLDDPDGNRFDFRKIEALAYLEQISLRTGCFCNPGTGEIVHNLTQDEMAIVFGQSTWVSYNDFFDWASNEHNLNPSTIRISVGIASNFEDVYRFIMFLQKFVDQPNTAIQQVDELIPIADFIRDSA
jgi:selenocysteine lyase/cysteine desulfurase